MAMGLKTKIAMAMGTSAAGAAMLVGGSFALFSASADTSGDSFTAGTVSVSAGQITQVESAQFSNMAPGDSVNLSYDIVNNGSLDEWVIIENTPGANVNGAFVEQEGLFKSFDKSKDANAGVNPGHRWDDQNAAGSGGGADIGYNSTDFAADNHPATYSYVVKIGTSNQVVASELARSVNDWTAAYTHPFLLRHGETAHVTYTVSLPLAAHNDYQTLSGTLKAEVDTVQARNNWYHKNDTTKTRKNGDPGSDAWPYSWQPDFESVATPTN